MTAALARPPRVASDLAAMLTLALDELSNVHPDDLFGDLAEIAEELDGAEIVSYDAAGILTRDAGLVLRTREGAEFQITIVQSSQAERVSGAGEDEEDDDDEG